MAAKKKSNQNIEKRKRERIAEIGEEAFNRAKEEREYSAHTAASAERGRRNSKIPNHLGKAIFTTLFCCLPLGIVSIVFAAQVDGKAAAGDLTGAREASLQADQFANISIGLGLVAAIGYFFLVVAAGG